MRQLHTICHLQFVFLLLATCWLLDESAFAQTNAADVEEREAARLASPVEEDRLSGLVELASLFKQLRRAPRPATTAALIQILRNDPAPVLRTHAARVLEYGAPSSATDALIGSLQTETEIATRKAVLYALARYQNGAVTAAIIPLLNHKNAELRATAAYALAELADTASASALLECLNKRRKDQDAFTRSEAARGLGRIGYRPALQDLRRVLLKDKPLVQRAAAEALGWLANPQDQEIIAALTEATRTEEPYLREAAQIALKRIAERAQTRS